MLIFALINALLFKQSSCSESQMQQLLEESIEANICILDGAIFKTDNLVFILTLT